MDNAEFRLALFPPNDGAMARPYLQRQEIYRSGEIVVLYSGQRLDPADLGVYLQLIRLAEQHPGKEEAKFPIGLLLEMVGRRQPGQAEWLDDTIHRLCGAVLDIGDGDLRYSGSLLKDSTLDRRAGTYSVWVDMKLAIFVITGVWLGGMRIRQ